MRRENAPKVTDESIANVLEKVFGPHDVEKEARQCGFLKRKRVLIPYALILACMSCLGCGRTQWLADILRAYNALTDGNLQYKPFHNQLSKPAFAEWMRGMLTTALFKLTLPALEAIPESKLAMFKDIKIHDGTSFALKATLKVDYPGRFNRISPAAVELHITMSGFENSAETIVMAPDKEAERHYRPDPAEMKGSLLLGDRAFEDILYFVKLTDENAFFIIRGKKNIRPTIKEVRNADGVQARNLQHLVGKKLSHRTLPRECVDLVVEWTKGKTTYLGRLVIFYRPGRRNKKDYTYLHTNLDRDIFSHADVGTLYRFRWQIELLNKELKQHANLHRFDTSKTPIAEGLIWASLLTATLQRYVTHAIGRAHGLELSTQRAAGAAMNFLLDIIRAIAVCSKTALRKAIHAAYRFLRANGRRAHPKRDRKRGRLAAGLQPAGG
jgi:hypothetical protein